MEEWYLRIAGSSIRVKRQQAAGFIPFRHYCCRMQRRLPNSRTDRSKHQRWHARHMGQPIGGKVLLQICTQGSLAKTLDTCHTRVPVDTNGGTTNRIDCPCQFPSDNRSIGRFPSVQDPMAFNGVSTSNSVSPHRCFHLVLTINLIGCHENRVRREVATWCAEKKQRGFDSCREWTGIAEVVQTDFHIGHLLQRKTRVKKKYTSESHILQ